MDRYRSLKFDNLYNFVLKFEKYLEVGSLSMCKRIKRATATFVYLALIFVSVAIAGLLKYAVAPAIVQLQSSSFITNSTKYIDGKKVAAELFYAISDCATRVDAWNVNNTAPPQNATLIQLSEESMLVKCIGNYFVYRVSFALSVVYLIFSVITKCSPLFHNGEWGTKMFIYCLFMIGSFFVPNEFFYAYSYVARIGSFLFILLQLIIIVDYAFDWHEDFLTKMEKCENGNGDGNEDGTKVKTCYCNCDLQGVQMLFLAVSFLHLIVALVGTVLLYAFYTAGSRRGCDENIIIITITLLLGLLITVTGLIQCKGSSNNAEDGDDGSIGLLVPSMVFCYCVYYAYDSVKANPNVNCHPDNLPKQSSDDAGAVIIGLIISAYSLVWVSMRTAGKAKGVLALTRRDSGAESIGIEERPKKKKRGKGGKGGKGKKNNQLERCRDDDDKELGEGGPTASKGIGVMEIDNSVNMERLAPEDDDDEDAVDTLKKPIWLFHFILAMGAFYMGMILTQWGGYTGATNEENTANLATALWVNAVGGWVAYAIFGWIRVAPLCCPNRDFRDVNDGF
jgi:hypothetical protein